MSSSPRFDSSIAVDGLGSFTLRKAHPSWTPKLLLGAIDRYGTSELDAYQIVPDEDHWTIDVPDLAAPWRAGREPVWQWSDEPWRYAVPPTSEVMTDLAALRGARILEATRWEDAYWEMFAGAGPDVPDEQARLVPLGCLLAADPSLTAVVNLEIGEGLWRDNDGGDWNPWVSRPATDT